MVHAPKVPEPSQRVRRWRRLTRHVPLAERSAVRHLGTHLRTRRHGDAARRGRVGVVAVAVEARGRLAGAPVALHVFPETRGVGVGLVAAGDAAVVRFVRCVHVRVLLAV